MKPRTSLMCLLTSALVLTMPALAEHTRYWRQSEFAEFEKGTPKGVAIHSDGKLTPAPAFVPFSDPNLAYLWALRTDSHGRLYAAGGSNAKVVRFDENGKPTTVFEAAELAAQAIALDTKDNLYVGTSPDGKVYKVTPDGQKSVFFEPKTKYIWALAIDSPGSLYVATGDKGEVFAVTPDGKGQLFYQSEQRHARSLALDSKGNLLIGTEPDGLILRVEVVRKNLQGPPTAGASFVIYETNKKEVTSLLQDEQGNLYAASIGEKPRAPGAIPQVPNIVASQPQAAAAIQAQTVTLTQTPAQQPAIAFPFFPSTSGGAEVVKISPDGSPEMLWTSRDDLVFTLGLSSNDRLLLGTGNKGAVLSLEGDSVYSNIAKSASAQVTSLIAGPAGKIYVATANPGKIFTLGPSFEIGGSFESEAFDAKIFSHWGRLTWWGENGGAHGKVEFYVRSGNTSNPEKNWSPWAGPYKNADGETVGCPPSRFVQWKAVFRETNHGGTPDISWVSLAYQPKNVAPVIDDIVIQDPGVRVQGFPQSSAGPGTSTPVQLRNPQHGKGGVPVLPSTGEIIAGKPSKNEAAPQGFEEKGWESVLWSAHDDNDDDLIFAIYYRGEGEKNWRLLKNRLAQHFYSWDTTTMPDGAYYLKIAASDSPSNPTDQALMSERESGRFEVANTPPKIENLRADATAQNARISFDGFSSSGAIATAQYSLDAADWKIVFPTGLLSDAPNENYQIQLSNLPAGEHTLAVRISDRFNNTTAAKVTFTIPTGASK